MIVLENFKIKKEGINFCIYELVERDEYKKNDSGTGAFALKTGSKVNEWVDVQSYHGRLKTAFKRVVEMAIERGFNDMKDISELIDRVDSVQLQVDKLCNG